MTKPFLIGCDYIEWAHGPGAEDRQALALRIFEQPVKRNCYVINDPVLVAEIADVAELYVGGRGWDREPRADRAFRRAVAWLAERGLTVKTAFAKTA